VRIYVFTEHYPNTFKPYFDTQFAEFLQQGHEVRVFAFGRFKAVINPRVRTLGLVKRTRYCPLTLRHLPAFGLSLLGGLCDSPRQRGRNALKAWDPDEGPRRNLLDLSRSLLLPVEPPDLCLVHNLVTAESFGFLGEVYPRARIVLCLHGGEIPRGRTIDAAAQHRAFARTHRVFTNTAFARDQAVARGCAPEKVVVNPVGFSLEDYTAPDPKAYRPDGRIRLLSVGRVSPEKGLVHALEAVRALVASGVREVRYRIIGAGPQLVELKSWVRTHGLGGHVEFSGERSSDEVVEAYRQADALVLPSVPTGTWAETQACVVQEALLMKLPVVATRAGGVPESLAPAMHRFLVPPGDASALQAQLRALLLLPRQSWRELGEAGRAFAVERYDIRHLNARLLRESLPATGQNRPMENCT
jgi:glycosyltransferase involved in cell wall biosynthesis